MSDAGISEAYGDGYLFVDNAAVGSRTTLREVNDKMSEITDAKHVSSIEWEVGKDMLITLEFIPDAQVVELDFTPRHKRGF